MSTAAISNDTLAAINGTQATSATKNDADAADRFLKLLVTQLQNQDPLNPMDNAQVTSQMAQINTVSGIEKLNTTVQGLNAQFVQMQALQGASLVGHDITVAGNRMAMAKAGGSAAFDLAGSADNVKVEVLNASGRVVDTLDLGSLGTGRHGFDWKPATAPAEGAEYRFRVTAKNGAAAVGTTALMRDQVLSVSTQGDRLNLQTLYSGDVAYADVKAFN